MDRMLDTRAGGTAAPAPAPAAEETGISRRCHLHSQANTGQSHVVQGQQPS